MCLKQVELKKKNNKFLKKLIKSEKINNVQFYMREKNKRETDYRL